MKRWIFFGIFLFLLPSILYGQTKIKLLTIEEEIINPVTAAYIERALRAAEKDDSLLIIKLDTPGGLLKSTEKIVKLILNSKVPVITYVYPKGSRAASAGVFIAYASHVLAMSPSTHIGAAHPIIGGGRWGDPAEEEKKKITNDLISFAENIAEARKRPVSFIKDAIEKSISITQDAALKEGVCDLIADDFDDLIKKIDGKIVNTLPVQKEINTSGVLVEEINLTKKERFLNILIEPNIAYLLLTLGLFGLIFEVIHPGFGFGGIAGTICLILSFYAFSILPINYAGMALLILGIIFFIAEAFTPAFGMLTLGGAICFSLGSIMFFNQPQFIKLSLKVVGTFIVALSSVSLFLLGKIIAVSRQKPTVGKEALIGKTAIAYAPIDREGKVFLQGCLWDAVGNDIKEGDEVVVEKVEGLTLYVKKVK